MATRKRKEREEPAASAGGPSKKALLSTEGFCLHILKKKIIFRMMRFELMTFCSQNRYATAALHSVYYA